MKELDALVKALDEKGVINSLKRTVSAVPFPPDVKTEEEKQRLVNEAIKDCLNYYFSEHDEVAILFGKYAVELALNELVKTLDIKPSEKTVKDLPDFLHKMIDDLFKK